MTLDAYVTATLALGVLFVYIIAAGVAFELLAGIGQNDHEGRAVAAILWPMALAVLALWCAATSGRRVGRYLAARGKGPRVPPAKVVR